jgi:uncharacterized cupredoxin-like copper-binding protein
MVHATPIGKEVCSETGHDPIDARTRAGGGRCARARPARFARGERQTAPTASTIQVKAGEFFFRFSSRSIRRPGKVTFVVKNVGSVSHDLKINRRTTPLISPGKTARLVVTFKKKGKYSYLCTVPGHAAAGMRGVFTVR